MSEVSISPYQRYGAARPVSDAVIKVHTYIVTDSLSLLAVRYYGDWRQWRVIADRNKIKDPRRIEPGTELIVPRLPLENGEYESR